MMPATTVDVGIVLPDCYMEDKKWSLSFNLWITPEQMVVFRIDYENGRNYNHRLLHFKGSISFPYSVVAKLVENWRFIKQ